ncbi:MAG TPA: glycosyltransferase [Pyrinomonadaceae bacterium]|nr:glycosyltransferase [Pyrinomonadaceae bacterium]
MKFALISNILPPSETAHAAIIHRLLRDLDPNSYCLLSVRDYETGDQPNYSERLPGKYYHLRPTFQLTRGYRFGMRAARERVNLWMGILSRARAIARILRREKCEAVVVCTGGNEILDFPAGYLASRLVGAKFYAYLLDQYSHMVSYVLGNNSFLQRLESLIMKGAAAVIAPNEFLRDELRRRYQLEAVVIRNACDLSVYEGPLGNGLGQGGDLDDDEIRIVYTGGVGPVHYDAFRNLLTALEPLKSRKARLHLYTAQRREDLEKEGIRGPLVYHEHEPVSAMPGIQQRADLLFLPLAFKSPFPEIVRTAAPGKMGEFLAAGRPILVHAPADSFVAWYFRQHECGLVIDQDDPAQLARAIETLINDKNLGERLGARARARAEADFGVEKARAQFAGLLGL